MEHHQDCSEAAWHDLDEQGATAVEYGLLLTGIVALIVLVVFAFGDNVLDLFVDTCDTVTSEAGGDCT